MENFQRLMHVGPSADPDLVIVSTIHIGAVLLPMTFATVPCFDPAMLPFCRKPQPLSLYR